MSAKRQIRCAIYTRKSSEEGLELEFNSLHAQREACEAYVASQKSEGWAALREHYDDGGYSGGTLERPALQHLLKDIEADKINVVVVYKIDRLSRSLMDFAKLVEVFDRKGVTFVSVTQSFNTTTSMGRLTLNVLLSFAQFERELTGERIRDKFAASKKKGMWMGGCPPLGYDIESRKLIVNAAEAATVNLIFQRYLDLGCVRLLRDDLARKRIISKRWKSSSGHQRGGMAFGRGALYCLLKNRLYLGQIMHLGEAYPGEHEAIVPRDLFEAAQQKLATTRRRTSSKPGEAQNAPLAGILFDDAGCAMAPTYSVKAGNQRYRYYASRKRHDDEQLPSIGRVPAAAMENLTVSALTRFGLSPALNSNSKREFAPLVQRIELGAKTVTIWLDRETTLQCWRSGSAQDFSDRDLLAHIRSRLEAGEQLSDGQAGFALTLSIRARFRGGRAGVLHIPGAGVAPAQPDTALIKALAHAHRWKDMLVSGEASSVEALAARLKRERRHVGRTLALAFLSPEITRAILNGEQPAGLRLSALLDGDIPLSWEEQREAVARLAGNKFAASNR